MSGTSLVTSQIQPHLAPSSPLRSRILVITQLRPHLIHGEARISHRPAPRSLWPTDLAGRNTLRSRIWGWPDLNCFPGSSQPSVLRLPPPQARLESGGTLNSFPPWGLYSHAVRSPLPLLGRLLCLLSQWESGSLCRDNQSQIRSPCWWRCRGAVPMSNPVFPA